MENNINPDTMNNIKNLVDSGDISKAISQISPEMIESFSKMFNNSNSQNTSNNQSTKNTSGTVNSNNSSKSNPSFDFSQIDMNTILKMKSAFDSMNNKNDPRSNLLYSLKPYLRHTKQEKIDQYVNLLNFSKVAEMLKNDKKDDKNV